MRVYVILARFDSRRRLMLTEGKVLVHTALFIPSERKPLTSIIKQAKNIPSRVLNTQKQSEPLLEELP